MAIGNLLAENAVGLGAYIRQNKGFKTKKDFVLGGAANFDASGSTGTFKLPTGAISFSGNITLAANETITGVAGTTALDLSLGTGVTKTTTGVNTIGGNIVVPAASSNTYDFSNSTGTFKTSTGINTMGGAVNINSASATALTVATAGAGLTNPILQVDASEATQTTGILIEGFASGSTVAIETLSGQGNEGLTIDGKGTGTLGINTVSTTSGLVTIGNSTSLAGATVNGPLTSTGFVKSTSATTGVGYGTGAGGAITQATSRTTGVTLNKVSGAITMFSAAGSATAASFTVSNTTIAAGDTVVYAQQSGTNLYEFFTTAITAATSFVVTFFTTGGTATDAPVVNFTIIKGVSA